MSYDRKIRINDADVWIVTASHITPMAGDERNEYFTASYHPIDPVIDPAGDTFLDHEHKPKAFRSPEAAIIMPTKNCRVLISTMVAYYLLLF